MSDKNGISTKNGRSVLGLFFSDNKGAISAVVIVVLFVIIYRIRSGIPFNSFQITMLLNVGLPLSFAALGLAFVVITGGIDLSIGSVVSLTNVIAATMLTGKYPHDGFVILLLLAVGFSAGLINGIFVAFVRLPSFIVTLASLFIWSGFSLLILDQPGGLIPDNFSTVLSGCVGNTVFPWAFVWIIVVFIGLFFFKRTKLYAYIFAIGSSEEAAYKSGIKIGLNKSLAYALAGMCYAISGMFLSAQTTGGDANIGNPYLLITFAALVVGGTPFGGGKGTFLGAIFGGYIMSLIDNLLLSFNVSSFTIDVVRGAIVIFVVTISSVGAKIMSVLRTESSKRG